jgi:hypothetical protein
MPTSPTIHFRRWVPWVPVVVLALMLWSPRVFSALSPVLFTALVLRDPDHFRTRNGSLSLAVGLIIVLTLAVVVGLVLSPP